MNENRVSLKNSVQPEFAVHGRLEITFYKQSKTTVMKIEFIDSEQKKLEGMKMEQKFGDFYYFYSKMVKVIQTLLTNKVFSKKKGVNKYKEEKKANNLASPKNGFVL